MQGQYDSIIEKLSQGIQNLVSENEELHEKLSEIRNMIGLLGTLNALYKSSSIEANDYVQRYIDVLRETAIDFPGTETEKVYQDTTNRINANKEKIDLLTELLTIAESKNELN